MSSSRTPMATPGAPAAVGSGEQITLTTATTGAIIRYTINGGTPTKTSGEVYSAPITITYEVAVDGGASASSTTIDFTFRNEQGAGSNE